MDATRRIHQQPQARHATRALSGHGAIGGGQRQFRAGRLAAGRALDLSPENSVERQRALLFRAAARVGAADFAQGPVLLREVDRARLPFRRSADLRRGGPCDGAHFSRAEARFASPPPGAANAVDLATAQAERSVKDADAALVRVAKSMERKTR